MKFILLAGAAGAAFVYYRGSQAAPGSDVGTTFSAGWASLHWPGMHGAGKKPCCAGCAGKAAGGAAVVAPKAIELMPDSTSNTVAQ